jgi:Cytochrome P450
VRSPPLVKGWLPYFGVWWDLKADPELYLRACYEAHGEVFTLYMCGRRYHMLWNHEDHHVFYLKPDDEVSGVAQPFVAVLGSKDAALFSRENKHEVMVHVAQWLGFFHRHVARGLSGQYMRAYTAGIHAEIRAGLGELPAQGELDLYQFLIDMSLRCTLRLMLGEGFLRRHPNLHDDVMTVKHYFDTYAADPFLKNLVLMLPTPQNFAIRSAIDRVCCCVCELLLLCMCV